MEKEVYYKFSKSGGKGGQHVNKTETKVFLYFDYENSDTLSENEKKKIKQLATAFFSSEGHLMFYADNSRSREKNRDEVNKKLSNTLRSIFKKKKKRIRTKPTKASKEKRLKEKKQKGDIKSKRKKIR